MARNQSCRQNFVPSGSCASFRSQPGLRDAGFSLKIDRASPAGLKWRISPCLQTSKLTRHLRSAGMKIATDDEPCNTKTLTLRLIFF